MRVPRRLLLVAVLAAVGVAAYIFWTPIQIRYRLWRTRAGDQTNPSRPHLCALGQDARQPVIDAFEKDGADPDMGNLRVVVAQSLRCLRHDRAVEQVGSSDAKEVTYADLPLDQSIEVIARAFLREPKESRRDQMKLYMDDLDFRARFRLYTLLAAGPYPVPLHLPTADPHEKHPGMAPEPIRKAWCDEMAPVVRSALLGKGRLKLDQTESAAAAAELMGNHCEPGDIDLMIDLANTDGPASTWALLALMTNLDRARIDRVFNRRSPCPVVDRFYSAILQREAALRTQAASSFEQIDMACLDRRCPAGVKDCRALLHDRLLKP